MSGDRLPVAPAPRPTGARTERCVLPPEPASVTRARRFARVVLAAWGRHAFEEAAELLASELVANAVLHARTPLEVELVDAGHEVLLVVSDSSTALPVVRRHAREAATGRGLWLLEEFSVRHGAIASAEGKQVWAVLRAAAVDGRGGALSEWLDEVEAL